MRKQETSHPTDTSVARPQYVAPSVTALGEFAQVVLLGSIPRLPVSQNSGEGKA